MNSLYLILIDLQYAFVFRDAEDVIPYSKISKFPVGAIHESPAFCAR